VPRLRLSRRHLLLLVLASILVAGLQLCPPPSRSAEPAPLFRADLSRGLDSWHLHQVEGAVRGTATVAGKGPGRMLVLHNRHPNGTVYLDSPTFALPSGRRLLELSFRYRTQGRPRRLELRVEPRDPAGQLLLPPYQYNSSYFRPPPSERWQPFRQQFLADARAARLQLGLSLEGQGRAELADLQVAAGAGLDAGLTVGRLLLAGSLPATLWTGAVTRKYLPESPPPPGNAGGGQLFIAACRGEREPCQLVFRPERAVTKLSVSISDLRGVTARLPASNFTAHYVGLVPVDRPRARLGRRGLLPDPLLDRPPLPIPAYRTQVIWITALVPPGTPAGDYSGAVTVTCDAGRAVVPLLLRVYDFDLPPQPTLATYARSWNSGPLQDAIRRSVAEHRCSGEGVIAPIPAQPQGEGVALDFTDFDAQVPRYSGYGFTVFHVPGIFFGGKEEWLGAPLASPQFDAYLASFTRQVSRHFADLGRLGQAHFQVWDEPHPEQMATVRHILQVIKDASPQAVTYLTTPPNDILRPLVDIWTIPLPQGYDEAAVRAEQATGRQVWAYDNWLYSLDVDASSLRMRCYPWRLKRFGLTGVEWWAVNYWPSDPYTKPNQYENMNGGGVLLYPNRQGPGVTSSLRWEMYRDGVDDHDYLTLLEQRVDRAAQALGAGARFSGREQARGLAGIAGPAIDACISDPEQLEQLRDQVARLVEWYGRPPTCVFDYRGGTLLGAVAPGAVVTVSQRPVPVRGGRFSVPARLPVLLRVTARGQAKDIRLGLWPPGKQSTGSSPPG